MGQTVFTLKKKKTTGELHLFRANQNPDRSCNPEKKSICKKMDVSDKEKNIFTCASEKDARIKCANIGRSVCGICVSSLYETYD